MPAPWSADSGHGLASYLALVVDDGSLVSPGLVRALSSAGFRVEVVSSEEDALAEGRARRYDAVLVNADLESVDGFRLCCTLREAGCTAAIVLLARDLGSESFSAALRAGANDTLQRDEPPDALLRRLLAHVQGARLRARGLLYPVSAEFPIPSGVLKVALVPTLIAVNENALLFSRLEERLLAALWVARGTVVAPAELTASAWLGQPAPARALQVTLSKLRLKLAPLGLALDHVRGRGYRLGLRQATRRG